MKINYNVTGEKRKELTYAIGEVIGQAPVYAGMPTAAYHMVGGFTVSKTGEFTAEGSVEEVTNAKIIARLEELGFTGEVEDSGEAEKPKRKGIMDTLVEVLNENAEDGEHWERLHNPPTIIDDSGREHNLDGTFAAKTEYGEVESEAVDNSFATGEKVANAEKPDKRSIPRLYTLDTPRGEIFIAEEFETHAEAAAEGYGAYFTTALGTVYSYADDRTFALVTSQKSNWDTTKIGRDFREPDTITVEIPKNGSLSDEKFQNLIKLAESKRSLLEKALGAPLQITDGGDTVKFVFPHSDETGIGIIYSQLAHAMVKYVKKHQRVTATEKEVTSEKFAMRTFLVKLGMNGLEYSVCRKWMSRNLTGNASFAHDDKYTAMQESRRKAEESEVQGDDVSE